MKKIFLCLILIVVLVDIVGADTLIVYTTNETDGYFRSPTTRNQTWENLRTTGTWQAIITGSNIGSYIGSDLATDRFYLLYRTFLIFNTSSLPDDASISAAKIGLYRFSNASGLGDTGVNIVKFNIDGTISIDDYDNFDYTRFSDDQNISTLYQGKYYNWSLNEAGIQNISKTDNSGFGELLGWDIDNAAPAWVSNTNSKFNYLSSDNVVNPPFLEITYTVPPVASFTANKTSGTVPLGVQFNDTSTNTPTDWGWYWYDNETKSSDEQNPEFTFTDIDTYDVRLYASNAAGGDWENKTGYITVSNYYDTICENQTGNITLNLFSNTVSSLGWNWNITQNITRISEDGLYVTDFDNSSDYFIGTGYQPGTWHRLKIYNDTDYGSLNCTTLAVVPTIPIMPSTESNTNIPDIIGYWWIGAIIIVSLVVFKKW